jgi:hypothetical protein
MTKNKTEGPVLETQVLEVTAVTAFAFHKLVNARLSLEGLTMTSKDGITSTKKIPPQMIYNYTHGRINKGKAPFIPLNSEGLINLEDGQIWLDKYISKLFAKVTN